MTIEKHIAAARLLFAVLLAWPSGAAAIDYYTPTVQLPGTPQPAPVLQYGPDSNYRSLYPTATPSAAPGADRGGPVDAGKPLIPPVTYTSSPPPPASQGAAGSSDEPIVDPESVPREIVFEPRASASPAPKGAAKSRPKTRGREYKSGVR